MHSLVRGQKIKLTDITSSQQLTVELGIVIPGAVVDMSCFGLDNKDHLSDERYMIFYNQTRSPENAIQMLSIPNSVPQSFSIDLARLPPQIVKLSFVATIDGQLTMSHMREGFFHLLVNGTQKVATAALVGQDYGMEKAMMILDIYKKDQIWRVANVGQGFAGGLSEVLKYFGGVEAQPTESVPPPQPAPAASPKLSLTKVTLEKRGDAQKIDLNKRTSTQPIHINLNWKPLHQGGGQAKGFGAFFGSLFQTGSNQTDLDLGCMYELQNGELGVIQPLGNYFGDKYQSPYIFLDKDDRSGQAQDGENLYLYRPELIKRVLVFAFIYEGTDLFRSVQSQVQILDQGQYDITIHLDNPDEKNPFCAVCLIENHHNQINITKEERYFADHQQADLFYRFGFKWRTGSK